jgi:hypothetical protein
MKEKRERRGEGGAETEGRQGERERGRGRERGRDRGDRGDRGREALTCKPGAQPNSFAMGRMATLMQIRSMLHNISASAVGRTTRRNGFPAHNNEPTRVCTLLDG